MLTDLTVGLLARSTTAVIPDALSPAVMVTNDSACVQFTAPIVAASAASTVTCAVPKGGAPGGRAGAAGVDEEHPAILPTSTASPAMVTNRFCIRLPRYVEHRPRRRGLKKNVATRSAGCTRKLGDSEWFVHLARSGQTARRSGSGRQSAPHGLRHTSDLPTLAYSALVRFKAETD